MSYTSEVYKTVHDDFKAKREKAESDAELFNIRLRKQSHDLDKIDRALSQTAMRIMDEIRKGRDGIEERIAKVRADNEQLQDARRAILSSLGYDPADAEPKYECSICNDLGSVDGKMCICFKRALAREAIRRSGIEKLLKTQSFESFSLDYYVGEDRKNAEFNLAFCRDYAEHFSLDESMNLTFVGHTGLGKTHLSTAIASTVIEKGFDVVYQTAQNIMNDFEHDKFARDGEELSKKYLDCELLIIDDLGTEAVSQYTVSFLYNIINTRINTGRKTIISTNLSAEELSKLYGDRITSRLLGEFVPLVFRGKDIRMQKLSK